MRGRNSADKNPASALPMENAALPTATAVTAVTSAHVIGSSTNTIAGVAAMSRTISRSDWFTLTARKLGRAENASAVTERQARP